MRNQFRACIAFTQRRCGDDPALDALLDARTDAPLGKSCEVVRAANREPGGGYVDHLKRLVPAWIESAGFDAVLVVLDDVALRARHFNLDRMVNVLRRNNLSVASPAVEYATHRHMRRSRQAAAVGRLVSMVEMFAVLYTPAAWRCQYELLDTGLNPIGWGYDMWLGAFCRHWRDLGDFKIGLVDTELATHAVWLDARHAVRLDARHTRKSGYLQAHASNATSYSRRRAREDMRAMIADSARRFGSSGKLVAFKPTRVEATPIGRSSRSRSRQALHSGAASDPRLLLV